MAFQSLKPGDRVTYRTPQGQQRIARVHPLLVFADHVVAVDVGGGPGRYARPVVVNASNFVHRIVTKRS